MIGCTVVVATSVRQIHFATGKCHTAATRFDPEDAFLLCHLLKVNPFPEFGQIVRQAGKTTFRRQQRRETARRVQPNPFCMQESVAGIDASRDKLGSARSERSGWPPAWSSRG